MGCSDDDDDNPVNPGTPGGAQSTLAGSFVNSNEGGFLTLAISSTELAPHLGARSTRAQEVLATGVLTPDAGGAINLTGTYNPETDTLVVSNGEAQYVLTGLYEGSGTVPRILGQYVGPNGPGVFVAVVGTTSSVSSFCGTFTNDSETDSGRWNFLIAGAEMFGAAAAESDGEITDFLGTVSGTGQTRDLMLSGQAVPFGPILIGTGTLALTTNQAGGFYDVYDGETVVDSGTWSVSLCPTGGTEATASRTIGMAVIRSVIPDLLPWRYRIMRGVQVPGSGPARWAYATWQRASVPAQSLL